MTLEARELKFVQEFLKIENEDSVSRLEIALEYVKSAAEDQTLQPMTKAELNKRIDQSESDFNNGRFKYSSDLLAKFEK